MRERQMEDRTDGLNREVKGGLQCEMTEGGLQCEMTEGGQDRGRVTV
jgi:hypothetical protein